TAVILRGGRTVKKSMTVITLSLLALAVACSKKDATSPNGGDTTVVTPPPPPPPPGPQPPPPPPPPSRTATIFAAGNIAKCSNANADATARLIDTSASAVFTLGNAANPLGDAATYSGCFDATWGRFKARIYPTMGNHDVLDTTNGVRNASGYYGYF